MAQPLDPQDHVTFKELLMANSMQVDALVQLLVEEGLITEQRFFQKLKQVQAQYQKRKSAKKPITATRWNEWKCSATAAMRTLATSSKMGPNLQGCGTASTLPR